MELLIFIPIPKKNFRFCIKLKRIQISFNFLFVHSAISRNTLKEVQPIVTLAKNSDWSSQWSSMRRDHGAKLGRVVCKMILQKYTCLWIDLSDVLVLTVYLGMDQIFTDYPTASKQMACIFCHFCHFSLLSPVLLHHSKYFSYRLPLKPLIRILCNCRKCQNRLNLLQGVERAPKNVSNLQATSFFTKTLNFTRCEETLSLVLLRFVDHKIH